MECPEDFIVGKKYHIRGSQGMVHTCLGHTLSNNPIFQQSRGACLSIINKSQYKHWEEYREPRTFYVLYHTNGTYYCSFSDQTAAYRARDNYLSAGYTLAEFKEVI